MTDPSDEQSWHEEGADVPPWGVPLALLGLVVVLTLVGVIVYG